VHREHELAVRDIGLLPEAEMHSRAGSSSIYEIGHDPKRYPMEQVLDTADLASSMKSGTTAGLSSAMKDADSGVRYWGAMGFLMRGEDEVKRAHGALTNALEDRSPSVRIAAAEALGRYGDDTDLEKALSVLITLANPVENGSYVCMQALNAISALGKKAAALKAQLKALPTSDPKSPERVRSEYTTRLIAHLLETL
jgi:uncharacterized sulfatase